VRRGNCRCGIAGGAGQPAADAPPAPFHRNPLRSLATSAATAGVFAGDTFLDVRTAKYSTAIRSTRESCGVINTKNRGLFGAGAALRTVESLKPEEHRYDYEGSGSMSIVESGSIRGDEGGYRVRAYDKTKTLLLFRLLRTGEGAKV